ncbi:hypothetical protein Y1Q_0020269 [Alligator mississippiensis]|uniref:SCAN box domain-containing protein n=1 Tax=Alligator mississippiensis TaxID=8496 RepID=A0A151PIQ6_ALLMI|nr:hypothetical protein Y1Q_0020269 [Alligator mississippiensis]
MDQVLLEQFLWDLEEDTQRWVQRHQPWTCEEALRLAEAFANSENEKGQMHQAAPEGRYYFKDVGKKSARSPSSVISSATPRPDRVAQINATRQLKGFLLQTKENGC